MKRICGDRLGRTFCALDNEHSGPHCDVTGHLRWPNKAEPMEGQGWFCSEPNLISEAERLMRMALK